MANRARSCFTAILSALYLTLVGCASPGSSVTQAIRVETPGCATASCELQNDLGEWRLASTPGTVTVRTSFTPLQVSCRAADGVPNTVGAQGSSRPLTAGGGVVGGVAGGAAVGLTVGATALSFIPVLGVVVLATGVAAGAVAGQAMESHSRVLRYPEQIDVPMSCTVSGAEASANPPAALLGLQVRGLSKAEALSAGLGDRGAVLVTSVTDNGRAAIAGLHSGDIILGVGGRDLSDPAMLEKSVQAAAGAPLALKIWRDGQTQVLVLARGGATP